MFVYLDYRIVYAVFNDPACCLHLQVLQISDLLENHPACIERSVIILFIFLSSVVIGRKEMVTFVLKF